MQSENGAWPVTSRTRNVVIPKDQVSHERKWPGSWLMHGILLLCGILSKKTRWKDLHCSNTKPPGGSQEKNDSDEGRALSGLFTCTGYSPGHTVSSYTDTQKNIFTVHIFLYTQIKTDLKMFTKQNRNDSKPFLRTQQTSLRWGRCKDSRALIEFSGRKSLCRTK